MSQVKLKILVILFFEEEVAKNLDFFIFKGPLFPIQWLKECESLCVLGNVYLGFLKSGVSQLPQNISRVVSKHGWF